MPESQPILNKGRKAAKKKTVLFIEDDSFVAHDYGTWLETNDFHVSYAYSVKQAMLQTDSYRGFDFVVVDIKMPFEGAFSFYEAVGGTKTGVLLARELLDRLPDSTFLALTNSDRADDQAWFEARGFKFHCKRNIDPPRFATYLKRISIGGRPLAFIVHGHDQASLTELRSYLKDTLQFPEPIVLRDKESKGLTVIEKFEYFSKEIEIVFVLMTPDDYVDPSSGAGRARQNVLLEFGFFLGRLGRHSGKVILLYKSGVEIPSDLSGIVGIDITHGITAAGEEILRELKEYLPSS